MTGLRAPGRYAFTDRKNLWTERQIYDAGSGNNSFFEMVTPAGGATAFEWTTAAGGASLAGLNYERDTNRNVFTTPQLRLSASSKTSTPFVVAADAAHAATLAEFKAGGTTVHAFGKAGDLTHGSLAYADATGTLARAAGVVLSAGSGTVALGAAAKGVFAVTPAAGNAQPLATFYAAGTTTVRAQVTAAGAVVATGEFDVLSAAMTASTHASDFAGAAPNRLARHYVNLYSEAVADYIPGFALEATNKGAAAAGFPTSDAAGSVCMNLIQFSPDWTGVRLLAQPAGPGNWVEIRNFANNVRRVFFDSFANLTVMDEQAAGGFRFGNVSADRTQATVHVGVNRAAATQANACLTATDNGSTGTLLLNAANAYGRMMFRQNNAGVFGIASGRAVFSTDALAGAVPGDSAARLSVMTDDAAKKGVVVRGFTGQAANPIEVQSVAGVFQGGFSPLGAVVRQNQQGVGDDVNMAATPFASDANNGRWLLRQRSILNSDGTTYSLVAREGVNVGYGGGAEVAGKTAVGYEVESRYWDAGNARHQLEFHEVGTTSAGTLRRPWSWFMVDGPHGGIPDGYWVETGVACKSFSVSTADNSRAAFSVVYYGGSKGNDFCTMVLDPTLVIQSGRQNTGVFTQLNNAATAYLRLPYWAHDGVADAMHVGFDNTVDDYRRQYAGPLSLMTVAGTRVEVAQFPASNTYAGIWFGQTPGNSTYALLGNATETILNAANQVSLRVADGTPSPVVITSAGVTLNGPVRHTGSKWAVFGAALAAQPGPYVPGSPTTLRTVASVVDFASLRNFLGTMVLDLNGLGIVGT